VKTETDTDVEDTDGTGVDEAAPATAATDDDVLDPVDPPADDAEERGGRLPRLLLTVAVALVVAAAAVAGWFGVAWFQAANDDSLAYSQTRDEVDRVARVAIPTMNTLDYRKVDEGLRDWETVTTGALHDQVVQGRAANKERIMAVQPVTKATVLSCGIVELDDRAGQASVLVAIKLDVRVKGAEPTEKFQRLAGKLQRTDEGWKLSEIGEVPYAQPGQ
jgi:Mce-associated membrane protein